MKSSKNGLNTQKKKSVRKQRVSGQEGKSLFYTFYRVASQSLLAIFQSLHEYENQNLNTIKLK